MISGDIMHEIRFYEIKDGELRYTLNSRHYTFTEAFQHYLVMRSLYGEEFVFKPSIPDEKLEEVVRNSDKEVVTIVTIWEW